MLTAKPPPRTGGKGRPRKYPWMLWFSKDRFRVKKGVHYGCANGSMDQQLRNAASKLLLKIKITEEDNGFLVVVTGKLKRGTR